MKSTNFNNAVQKLNILLTEAMPEINERVALNGAAMVKDRIVNTGVNASGQSLGRYSDNPLPAFFFKDKWLNAGGKRLFDLKTKKQDREKNKQAGKKVGKNKRLDDLEKGISYKDWREANNRPTDHVTLSFTGDTMRDIGVQKKIVAGVRIVTTIGPRNTKQRSGGDTTEKIVDDYLGPKYGNFLAPNDPEIEKLKEFLQNQVIKIIHESFK